MVLLTSRGLIDDGDVGYVDTAAEVRAMAAKSMPASTSQLIWVTRSLHSQPHLYP